MADPKQFKPVKFCSRRFGFVVLMGGLLGFQDQWHTYGQIDKQRTVFTDAFMETNFGNYHKMTVASDAPTPKHGMPDAGAGMYSRQLPYKDWYEFNILQRVHGNSKEHLSWLLPLMFVQGIFLPRFTASMAAVVLVGRELYRIGYVTKEGPSSKIRELGAVPLNAAEFFLIGSVSFYLFKRWSGNFFSRRKFVRRFTFTPYEKRMEEITKQMDLEKKGLVRKPPTLIPMHPKIMSHMADRQAEAARAAMTPSEKRKEEERAKIPDIRPYM